LHKILSKFSLLNYLWVIILIEKLAVFFIFYVICKELATKSYVSK
jgi:hypothetical protein